MKKWMLRVINNLAKVTELGSARPGTQAPGPKWLTTVPCFLLRLPSRQLSQHGNRHSLPVLIPNSKCVSFTDFAKSVPM